MLPYFEEEHEEVRRLAAEVAKEFEPLAPEVDRREDYAQTRRNLLRLGELDLLGIRIPEEHGGSGMDVISYLLVLEELSKVCGSTATSYDAHNLAIDAISIGGSEEQKRRFLPRLAKDAIGAFALTEPQAGTDAASIRTRAVRKGSSYVITGEKHYITNGGIADLFVVFAKTNPEKGARGISAFVVEKDTPGLRIGKIEEKMGIRGSSTAQIFLEEVEVPEENLLRREGMGFPIAMRALDVGRLAVGGISVGTSKKALEIAANYARERVQFGKPIASFQAIQFYVAEMATRTLAAEIMTYNTAWLHEQGKPITKEAAAVKVFASETALYVTDRAIQILGGAGYLSEYPVERGYRDSRIGTIAEGTSEILRLIVAREIVGALKGGDEA